LRTGPVATDEGAVGAGPALPHATASAAATTTAQPRIPGFYPPVERSPSTHSRHQAPGTPREARPGTHSRHQAPGTPREARPGTHSRHQTPGTPREARPGTHWHQAPGTPREARPGTHSRHPAPGTRAKRGLAPIRGTQIPGTPREARPSTHSRHEAPGTPREARRPRTSNLQPHVLPLEGVNPSLKRTYA
jgi:hypothetical protein